MNNRSDTRRAHGAFRRPREKEEHGLPGQDLTGANLSGLPCLRYLMTDASLYREQTTPYQYFGKRWQSMDLVDISLWASDRVRTIEVSPVFADAPFKLEVRHFVPLEGDLIEEV